MNYFSDLKARDEAKEALDKAYLALSAKEKRAYMDDLYAKAMEAYEVGKSVGGRNGQTQGFAFLWIDLYGKGALDKAFRAKVKKASEKRIIQNYRGAKNAWYFGSQSNVGIYDGLVAMARFLYENGVKASQGDAWD